MGGGDRERDRREGEAEGRPNVFRLPMNSGGNKLPCDACRL